MATKAKKKKSRKGIKSYRRVIYVTARGSIAKVEDGNGIVIKGKKLVKPKNGSRPKLRNLVEWNLDERCVYSASGRCYC
jgi:hypothetical protein